MSTSGKASFPDPRLATPEESQRIESLIHENAVLSRALGAAQQRSTQQAATFARRVEQLEAELLRQRAATIVTRTALALQSEWLADHAEPAPTGAATPAGQLSDRAVLCIGGRPASVPLYRLVVERTGGRFLHHDGGARDSPSRLDATLAAADLVICQAGCVSHDAYWRVQDHCKRTGKRCYFVEAPSRSALERALAKAAEAT